MAGVGPVPKDPSQRRRRNADITAGAVLPRGGPEGPTPALPGGHDYDTRTLSWYETWRTAPQASAFLATDWQRLHMLAQLVEQYWQEPRKDLLAEIRLNEASLGGTAADRVRLRWSVADEEAPAARKTPGKNKAAASRRDRVLKVVNDQPESS
ncbi:phage terminase small subunit [Streptomyces celluloflavus]|uniref:phage terminase small subunit n=1 Tax=Streptomyces celluloflavus TaxID=58344 RepID=UPI0036A90269